MSVILKRKEAIKFIDLDDKTFDNYFKEAGEFSCLPRKSDRGPYYFEKEKLLKWKENYDWRMIELTIDDYALCLDFALAQHFRSYVLSDWGTGRQREFGQKISNWIKGQIAELATKKFLRDKFNTDIDLDFEIHNEIVPQDVIGIKAGDSYREAKIGIGIKATKPKSAYLILGKNEVEIADRQSEVYILCRPALPDDHLLQIAKPEIIKYIESQPHYHKYKSYIQNFTNIRCEIVGWCEFNELQEITKISGYNFGSPRLVKKSGELHKDVASWQRLIKRI